MLQVQLMIAGIKLVYLMALKEVLRAARKLKKRLFGETVKAGA